jgi:anti-sigma-K factor RsiG
MGDDGMPRGGEGFDWEGAEDLTALSEEDLRARLAALAEEERGLSYGLRIVQGRMDVMRAELVSRGAAPATLSPEELARALLGEVRVPGRRS